MNQYKITLSIAGLDIPCIFEFSQNYKKCRLYKSEDQSFEKPLRVGEVEKGLFTNTYPDEKWNYNTEEKCMIPLVSDYLLQYSRLVFHCVAFVWNEKAWLITAPSGTGKTTQYRNLRKLYGEEIEIISGDNPVLHFKDDGSIVVYPSPWNGKENYRGNMNAELGGIIWLQQNNINQIETLKPEDAIMPIFRELNTYTKTEEQIHQLLRLEERLLTAKPIWKYSNDGTVESSRILMNTLREYEGVI